MQIRESQIAQEETGEFMSCPPFRKRTWLHSDSGKWSKIRDDNRAKTACQVKEEEGLV